MLLNFFKILARPRQTMRRILDSGGGRWAIPIILLGFVSGTLSDSDLKEVRKVLPDWPTAVIIVCVMLGAAIAYLVFFYIFGWIATGIGRFLEGKGPVHDVRAALAWGLAPLLLSPIYRIPAALMVHRMKMPTPDEKVALFEVISRGGCTFALLFAFLDFAVTIWYVVVASATLAEAHRFSSWRGFGVLAISAIIPVVIAAAAFLTLSM